MCVNSLNPTCSTSSVAANQLLTSYLTSVLGRAHLRDDVLVKIYYYFSLYPPDYYQVGRVAVICTQTKVFLLQDTFLYVIAIHWATVQRVALLPCNKKVASSYPGTQVLSAWMFSLCMRRCPPGTLASSNTPKT